MCLACEMAEWAEMEAAMLAAGSKRKGRKARSSDVAVLVCDAPAAVPKKQARKSSRSRQVTRVRASAGRD